MLQRIWLDDRGSVISCEVILLTTVLVIGVIVGAKSFRDAAVTEWADYAQAIANLDQSYEIDDGAGTNGSRFIDARDFCDSTNGPTTSTNGTCIEYGIEPAGE